jgi:regulator of replication initiation timing
MKRICGLNGLNFGLVALAFALAAAKLQVGVQTTLVGYDLGRLKSREASLLEERSLLKMELAKMTTRSSLSALANAKGNDNKAVRSFAAR